MLILNFKRRKLLQKRYRNYLRCLNITQSNLLCLNIKQATSSESEYLSFNFTII